MFSLPFYGLINYLSVKGNQAVKKKQCNIYIHIHTHTYSYMHIYVIVKESTLPPVFITSYWEHTSTQTILHTEIFD